MNLKKIITLCTVLALMLALLASCSGNADDMTYPGYKQIAPDNVGYKFYVPEDWEIQEKAGICSAHAAFDDRSNVSLVGYGIAESEFSDVGYYADYEKQLSDTFGEINFEEKGTDTTLGGLPAKKYIFTANIGGQEYKYMQVLCFRLNKEFITIDPEVYTFTYTAEVKDGNASLFDRHFEEVVEMTGYISFDE